MLDDEDSEFDEMDDDDDATFAEDIGGDRVVDDRGGSRKGGQEPL